MELALHSSQIIDELYSMARQITSPTVTLVCHRPESAQLDVTFIGNGCLTCQHVTPYRMLLYVDTLCPGILGLVGSGAVEDHRVSFSSARTATLVKHSRVKLHASEDWK